MSTASNGRAREHRTRDRLAESGWQQVQSAPRYLISKTGHIWSLHLNRKLALTPNPQSGHMHVRLVDAEGNRPYFKVHRLVALAFIGPPPSPRHEVCHNDGNPANNSVANLRWDTRSQNVLDQVRHGTHVQARKTHCPRNHAYDELNTYLNRQGKRECRACHREAMARRRASGEVGA